MIITRRSEISGVVRSRDLPVTEEQLKAWENGMLIQVAMPQLSADDREFILTGSSAEEWNDLFGDDN